MTQAAPILPGGTLGVFGGGQLGRMFAQTAQRMGYRAIVFAPETDCPAGQVAHEHRCAAYDDEAAVTAFAGQCDAVTIEFENVPVQCLEWAAARTTVRPGSDALSITQDRLAERAFLDRHGLPTSPHAAVDSAVALRDALQTVGRCGVLKAAREGYDGRGQVAFGDETDPDAAWRQLNVDTALYEAWVDYQLELSVLVARSSDGSVETFGPIENHHVNHILDVSTVPAGVPVGVADSAIELARGVAGAMQLQGLICVEMFLTTSGELVINELAPRPHNSGHLTVEAATVSQFEQQVRAMAGLPLGVMQLRQPAAMVNLLGDLWEGGEPHCAAALRQPGTSLHLYGKETPRPGRKMGHLTTLADTVDAAKAGALAARQALVGRTTAPTG